jgi:hypothetical protein
MSVMFFRRAHAISQPARDLVNRDPIYRQQTGERVTHHMRGDPRPLHSARPFFRSDVLSEGHTKLALFFRFSAHSWQSCGLAANFSLIGCLILAGRQKRRAA